MKVKITDNNNKGFNTPLFLFYQSTSDDLVFWPLFDVLFLSLAKGYTDAAISLVFSVSLWIGIGLKFLSYRPIKKLRAGTSMMIAALLFLSAALLITFGNAIWLVIAGQCLYRLAFSFQEMSSVFLQKAVYQNGAKINYIRIKDIANILYSIIGLVTMLFLNKLCNISMMLPMYVCIGFCINSVIMTLFLYRYDNTDNIEINNSGPVRPTFKKIDRSAVFCLILSALAAVILSLGMENLRIAVKTDLSVIFDSQKTIFYFSLMLIINRMIKCLGNLHAMLISDKKTQTKNNLSVYIIPLLLIPILGLISCFGSGYMPIILASLAFFIAVFVYDPFITRLTKMLIQYMNSENMKFLIYMNSMLRDFAKAAVSSVITLILVHGSMKGVMLLLTVIAIVLIVFFMVTQKDLARKSNNRIYSKWTDSDFIGVDDLTFSVAVLLCQNNIELSKAFTPLQLKNKMNSVHDISVVHPRVSFGDFEEYAPEALKRYFNEGKLCMVHLQQKNELIWLPVLFADDDGMILYTVKEKYLYSDYYSTIDRMCSFICK